MMSSSIQARQAVEKLAQDILIPTSAGSGEHRKRIQHRTLSQWTSVAVLGLVMYYQNVYPLQANSRAAVLGLVFPGAGYIASANGPGIALLAGTYLLLPVALFAWFGAGAILFPVSLWIISIPGAYFATGESVFEHSGIVSLALLFAFFGYFNRLSVELYNKATAKREQRNAFLPASLADVKEAAVVAPADADRELSLEDLRDIQYVIDEGLKAIDDWENFTVIDQFQTSALRYQLYEMMYCLGAYQGIYVPNMHSYVSEAFRKIIDKSLTPKVLSFWKWETLWGKFSTNYDPVVQDNIMVSGFLLQGLMLYTANTGDQRYTKQGSLQFNVTKDHVYAHDLHTLDEALVTQWKENEYCLFPCEPNWIYTPCNLQGLTGQVIYDRVFGTDSAKKILPAFEASLTSNFTEPDGSILPIRSELTGFTIPGLCGALSDLVNALLCRGHLDHIAQRMWAIFRHECVQFDQDGELKLVGLVGADKLDPGNYSSNEYSLFTMLGYVAGEYGDEKVRQGAKKVVENKIGKYTTATGATALNKERSSASTNSCNVRASLLRHEDWKNLISKGPSKVALAGPILHSVPYPGVLVAKARSHTSTDLNVVLYPSAASGQFSIGVSRLIPNQVYSYADGKTARSNAAGIVYIDLVVDGRTEIHLKPIH